MARCGCAGQSCGCLVIAGTGAVVTGAGTAQDPYVVSLQGSRLSVIDSPTIDLTLTGTGDSISPYVLRADFIGTIPVPDTTPAESRTAFVFLFNSSESPYASSDHLLFLLVLVLTYYYTLSSHLLLLLLLDPSLP